MENKDFIISKFKEVKSLEYVPSNRANNTGIGKTFEDYIGVVENNLDEPDLAGFEIKSHRGASCSYVTLFTKSPSFPKRANAYLKDLKSATKLFSVLLASKRPLITELADKLRLKYPLLPTISPCPTMRLEAIRSIIPISCRRYPKSV